MEGAEFNDTHEFVRRKCVNIASNLLTFARITGRLLSFKSDAAAPYSGTSFCNTLRLDSLSRNMRLHFYNYTLTLGKGKLQLKAEGRLYYRETAGTRSAACCKLYKSITEYLVVNSSMPDSAHTRVHIVPVSREEIRGNGSVHGV